MAEHKSGLSNVNKLTAAQWVAGISDKCAACPSMQAGKCSALKAFLEVSGSNADTVRDALIERLQRRETSYADSPAPDITGKATG